MNYATTEKELLAIVFGLENFKAHLIGSLITIYIDHTTIEYLMNKSYSKPSRWVLMLQEFNLTIKDKKGSENLVAYHLSRLSNK